MRSDVTQSLSDALAAATVSPLRLLEIELPTRTLRCHNTNTSVTWSGQVFDQVFEGGAVQDQDGGGQECAVQIDTAVYINDRPELAPEFIDTDARKAKVKLYEGVLGELIQVFDGEIASYSMSEGWVSCDLRSAKNSVIDVRIAPPFIQVVTPAGTIVQVGGETVVIGGA